MRLLRAWDLNAFALRMNYRWPEWMAPMHHSSQIKTADISCKKQHFKIKDKGWKRCQMAYDWSSLSLDWHWSQESGLPCAILPLCLSPDPEGPLLRIKLPSVFSDCWLLCCSAEDFQLLCQLAGILQFTGTYFKACLVLWTSH